MPQSESSLNIKKIDKAINENLTESGHAILIVDRNCPICEEVVKKFSRDSRIVICPLDDTNCLDIARSARIQGVPRLIVKASNGMKICKLSDDGLTCASSERKLHQD